MAGKKILTLLLAFSFFTSQGFADFQTEDYTIIKDMAKLPVLTPSIAQRKTQKIRLNNGLEAYLISDPEADISGAMLSVNVGSWSDPKEHPGMAHFLEHMLFLGTLKYPKESEYSHFISEHGGQSNAFTTNSSTSFLFTVKNDGFLEAISRFSSFFKEPLFNSSGVSRELQAIDQEYAKNQEHDAIRQIYVLKEFVNPEHPYHNFNMGNSESLSNATRDKLEDWFVNHYSSNLMRLVVYSSLPIDELRQVVNNDFSAVPNRNHQKVRTDIPALSPDLEGNIVYIEPIKDTRTLTIVWELPSKFATMEHLQPEQLISYVLGHEGEKSLLAQLKREKLAEGLGAGGTRLGDDLMMLYLQVELTNTGLTDVDQVITRSFQAIKNLNEQGIPKYLFDEIKQLATVQYQYQAKDKEFMMLMKHAYQIHDEELATYPEHSHVVQQYDPQTINDFVSELTPQNARFFIMAPSKLTGVKPTKSEKWLGVEYAIEPISRDTIDKWNYASTHSEIDLPAANIFVPDDLRLVYGEFVPSNRPIPIPIQIVDGPQSTIYFAHDDKFGVPKISWHIHIRTPHITLDSPTDVVFGDLLVKGLKEDLNRFSYPAKMAGLEYDIKREDNGIAIQINGYSQNAHRLFEEVLRTIENYTPNIDKFKIYKDSLLRKYSNFAMEKPLDQSVELFKSVLYQDFITEKEKATAIRKISFKKFQAFVSDVFNQTFIEGLFYGNMTEEQAKDLTNMLHASFNKGFYPKEKHFENAVIVLPDDQGPYYLESRTKSQGNAVLLAIENSTFSFKERAAQQVLMQAIQQPFFASLRTKQQTGYLVHSFSEEVERKLFNLFAVQSNTHDVRDLLSRFEAFIEHFLQELGKSEFTEDQFENIKRGLLITLEEPANNLKTMGELLNTLAFDYDGNFDWLSKRIQGLRDLTYEEFLVTARDFLGRQNKRRLAILLKGEIPDENIFSYTRARTWNMIRKLSDYEVRKNGG